MTRNAISHKIQGQRNTERERERERRGGGGGGERRRIAYTERYWRLQMIPQIQSVGLLYEYAYNNRDHTQVKYTYHSIDDIALWGSQMCGK